MHIPADFAAVSVNHADESTARAVATSWVVVRQRAGTTELIAALIQAAITQEFGVRYATFVPNNRAAFGRNVAYQCFAREVGAAGTAVRIAAIGDVDLVAKDWDAQLASEGCAVAVPKNVAAVFIVRVAIAVAVVHANGLFANEIVATRIAVRQQAVAWRVVTNLNRSRRAMSVPLHVATNRIKFAYQATANRVVATASEVCNCARSGLVAIGCNAHGIADAERRFKKRQVAWIEDAIEGNRAERDDAVGIHVGARFEGAVVSDDNQLHKVELINEAIGFMRAGNGVVRSGNIAQATRANLSGRIGAKRERSGESE